MTEKENLGRSTLRGLLWLFFQSASARMTSVISQLVLAKLLLPSQFGAIGIVYILTGIASAVTNFGIDGVLLQRDRAAGLWSTAAFWASLGLGAAGLGLVLALGPIFSDLYHSAEIARLADVFAISMPLGALTTVPAVQMRARMNYRFPAIYGAVETFILTLATILLAYFGAGVWSFVLPTPAAALVKAVVYWLHSPVRLRFRARVFQYGYLFGNGLSVFGSKLIIQMIGLGDYAVLGLVASHSVVGYYYFAFRLAVQPIWILAGNFSNVLFPALVQLRADPARQLAAALRAAEFLSYLAMPVCFLQAAAAAPALELFFGRKWAGSIDLVRLLSLGVAFDAATWVSGSLLIARGDFRRGFLYTLVTLPIFFGLVGLGAVAGSAFGVALMVAVYYLFFGPINALVVFGRYGGRAADVARLYVKPPLMAGCAVGVGYLLSLSPPIRHEALARLGEMALVTLVLYALLLKRFEPGVLTELSQRFGVTRLLSGAGKLVRPLRAS